jgi:phage baseplate assembly protein W
MKHHADIYLGNGLSFPLRTDARGHVALVTGIEDIEQAIRIILGTRPGERVMRPNFGCRAHELLFEPSSAATMSMMQEYVHQALHMWEPRIEVQSVHITADSSNPSVLRAEITYTIKAIHDTRSIVYPFFVEEEQEVI